VSLYSNFPSFSPVFRVELGVVHGLGGTDTYALFIMRLCVGVTLLRDIPDILENALEVVVPFVLGVSGTARRGVAPFDAGDWLGRELDMAFRDCIRLIDGDSINTMGFLFWGVTESAEGIGVVSEQSARGSGLSSSVNSFTFGGGVTVREGGCG
jgi:hypothetical protein